MTLTVYKLTPRERAIDEAIAELSRRGEIHPRWTNARYWRDITDAANTEAEKSRQQRARRREEQAA